MRADPPISNPVSNHLDRARRCRTLRSLDTILEPAVGGVRPRTRTLDDARVPGCPSEDTARAAASADSPRAYWRPAHKLCARSTTLFSTRRAMPPDVLLNR